MKIFNLIAGICLLLLSLTTLEAQELNLGDVKKFYNRGTGPIMGAGEVIGYYFFYEIDKVKGEKNDKDKRKYKMIITDANLAETSNKTITEDKDLILTEGCYNGEFLAFKYYNIYDKEPYQKIKIFDKDVNVVTTRTMKIDKKVIEYVKSIIMTEDADGTDLYPVPQKGFLDFMPIITKKGGLFNRRFGTQLTFIPNTKGDSTSSNNWTYKTKEEIFETPDFINASSEIIYISMGRKAKLKSKEADMSLVGFDVNTGKKLFDKVYENEKYTYQVMNLNYSTLKKEHTVFGNIYDTEAFGTTKAKSLGIYVGKIDNNGNELLRKEMLWDKFKKDYKFKDEDGDESEIGNIFIHKLISTKDGKIFAIGERFKKALDAGSTALRGVGMLMGGGLSSSVNFNLVLQHMILIELDKELNIKDVQFFDKGKNKVLLPGSFAYLNVNVIASIAKGAGWFDYAFTQEKKDKTGFIVGFNTVKDDDGLGTIVYNNGKFSQDKIPFTKKAKYTRIFPGKFGYILIQEYFKKEKKIFIRLEKINM